MKNFVLIGAAGYVAPRHMKAIKATGNNLVAALDKSDSVGIIDSYFPKAAFFTEFERFDRHLEKLKRSGTKIDYVSVCSPNYLHDAHIRFGLRHGADVICEKPLVLNPWNLDALADIEKETEQNIYTILQLRLHPSVQALKKEIENASKDKVFEVELTYITSRGNWYYASWKGDESKSGGIATNIGIHFFDMLIWLFGSVQENNLHLHTHDRAAGYLRLERAEVKWFLSINAGTLPAKVNGRTYRSLTIENREFEFSDGFTDLHTKSYEAILKQKGFRINATRSAVVLSHEIRNSRIEIVDRENTHPLINLKPSTHPFFRKNNFDV